MWTLLGEVELGDRRPSVLLREMRTLAGTNSTDDLLRTLWLKRLPPRVRELLSILEDVNLDKLAACADKAMECTTGSAIYMTSEGRPTNSLEEIQEKLKDLDKKMEVLSTRTPRSRSTGRPGRKQRGRSKSGGRNKDNKICYYHQVRRKGVAMLTTVRVYISPC